MGKPRTPESVKLICGLLGADVDLLKRARQLLGRRFGPVDLVDEIRPFDQTDYYEQEMGPQLKRAFVSFEPLIRPDALVQIKLETNALEAEMADQCAALEMARPVNLDPGYVEPGKLVLATTKDRGHRIHLGLGIYAEVTLRFARGRWQPWPWTYPDYAQPDYHEFFLRVRERLREQRRGSDAASTPVGEARP